MLLRSGILYFLVTVGAIALLVGDARAYDQEKEEPIITFVKSRIHDANKPFTIIVAVQVKDGSGKTFEDAFVKALPLTRKEKGSIGYDLNRDARDSKRYLVYERWKSLADLENHIKTDYIKALLKVFGDVSEGTPELQVLVPVGE
jgi:quinol monooxygenase YgiN